MVRHGGPWGRLSMGHWLMIVAGLVAIILNYAFLRSHDQTTMVAVATGDLPSGSLFDPAKVEFTPVPVDSTLGDALISRDDLDAFDHALLIRRVPAGTLVLRSDLRAGGRTDGMRAMSIPLEPEYAVGGALAPGDHIDVIQADDGAARFVTTNREILAVLGGDGGALGAGVRFAVTVQVDAETALRLSAALSNGPVYVVRSNGTSPPEIMSFPPDDQAEVGP